MSFSPVFSIGQNPLSPNIVVATDESTGSDALILSRRIYVSTAAGTYLVPSGTSTDYTTWSIANLTISLNILTTDQAVSCTVQWLGAGNVVLYTSTNQFCLPLYNKQFAYYLVQQTGLNPSIPADTNYNSNLAKLWSLILGAISAVEDFDDIAGSQNTLDQATYLRLNQNNFF